MFFGHPHRSSRKRRISDEETKKMKKEEPYQKLPFYLFLIRSTCRVPKVDHFTFTLRLVGTVSAAQQLKLILAQEATAITFAAQLRSRFHLLLQIPGKEIYPKKHGAQPRIPWIVLETSRKTIP
ncbi:hypothetical protein F2Q69_00004517 [Brassica cretica]|uniref:Uncharacterized protein n=1 Tax=Brassica cretica TaxID=69181 RepID=A0A8S9P291_BRACR|nr:hypothetical protein F2Q69_00004517 [Brassica cretica]